MSAPVTMQTALQIIRTYAAFERDHPGVDVLVPDHVLKLCDEALGIVPEAGQEAENGCRRASLRCPARRLG